MKTRAPMVALGVTVLVAGGSLVWVGCHENQPYGAEYADLEFHVLPSAREIKAGEIVTVTAETQNVYGRDATIEWTATGGDLKTEGNKRIARVQYNRPGEYTVIARLMIDGRPVREDHADVRVEPVM